MSLEYIYEPGTYMSLLQLLAKTYPNIDDCMFKSNKLESTLCCKDFGHTDHGVYIDWSLHVDDSSNLQAISGILHQ